MGCDDEEEGKYNGLLWEEVVVQVEQVEQILVKLNQKREGRLPFQGLLIDGGWRNWKRHRSYPGLGAEEPD